MGHKVNPIGLRVGINRTWDSRWYAGRDYADLLEEDVKIRKFLNGKLGQAGVSDHRGDMLSAAVQRAWDAGIFVVVSAGTALTVLCDGALHRHATTNRNLEV